MRDVVSLTHCPKTSSSSDARDEFDRLCRELLSDPGGNEATWRSLWVVAEHLGRLHLARAAHRTAEAYGGQILDTSWRRFRRNLVRRRTEIERPSAYYVRIVRSVVRDILQSRTHRSEVSDEKHFETRTSGQLNPEQALLERERQRIFDETLRKVSSESRSRTVDRDLRILVDLLGGQTVRSIADREGMKEASVYKVKERMAERLRSELIRRGVLEVS